MKLLAANRGEIALRVLRAAAERGHPTVAVHSEDDADSLHLRRADEVVPLRGQGAAAYLGIEGLVEAARSVGAEAVHPGYGFLSESAEFAAACEAAGLVFVGPPPETLAIFGDKARALDLADECGVPVLEGTRGPTTLGEALEHLARAGDESVWMVKAVAGGGGRGMRRVRDAAELTEAWERCAQEARASFGNDALYLERFVPRARHIEVQIVGDGKGAVVHLGERECSLQRRHQKLVEIAPSPTLSVEGRDALCRAALRMARKVRYRSLGTFEFLVDEDGGGFAFIEANARLQVEHTVTEEVTGIDLVQAQLRVAEGESLEAQGLEQAQVAVPRGHAIQLRVNLETLAEDGSVRPSGGTLSAYDVPSGPGIRVDGYGYAGYTTNPRFDSLIAKLIAWSPGPYERAVRRALGALAEFRIEGVPTNLPFLTALLRHRDVQANAVTTRFVEEHVGELVRASQEHDAPLSRFAGAPAETGDAGPADPLAVLDHGKSGAAGTGPVVATPLARAPVAVPPGCIAIEAPLPGTLVSLDVTIGDEVAEGQALGVMEAMKMEHVIRATCSGTVRGLPVTEGEALHEGHPLVFLEEGEVGAVVASEAEEVDLDRIRPDLAEVLERHRLGLDEARPESVARRRKTGQRTARENVEDLCDEGSYVEWGPLVIAAQRRRREVDDLIRNTPADGMLGGVGTVNAELFGEDAARCAVLSYDYTVLAGTQGSQNHRKKDRLFEVAEKARLPVVFFTEGGGGRPGDTDGLGIAGLDCRAFQYFAALSGLVPIVGINSGRCFAGNAALLGCCDVVIATANSNIGMGGPAMIEGGGLGVFRPEEVGPMSDQVPNGVVDIAVEDEEEAVAVAKKYLAYFQGPTTEFDCADQRRLRHAIPENRLRIYDVREVIETLADTDSVLELRRGFGHGMVTSLARFEGRPVGILANDPTHLAGAIDADGADKATRFMQLCDAFDLPILMLCDTPGIMVGPESEKEATVRHASRMFVTSASLSVPFFTIILRKGYGLGAQAMAGGSFHAPFFTVSWPTGEFGGMGLEGAVKLGYRKELQAETDPVKRAELYEQMVARMYEHGKAVNAASHFEIDDVIDPFESRTWILRALKAQPPPPPRTGKKRPCIDTW